MSNAWLKLTSQSGGAASNEPDATPHLHFGEEAQDIFFEWLTELQAKLQQDEEPVITEHLGKYRSLMPSLALIFHLIEIADGAPASQVCSDCARRAAAMCEYLEAHARRVYGMVCNRSRQSAAKLATKLKAGVLKDGFTVRDVYRKEWSMLNDADAALAACEELVEAGWLRESVTPPGPGQRPKTQYLINPAMMTATDEKISQTPTQKPDKPDTVPDFANVSGLSGSHLSIQRKEADFPEVTNG